MTLNQYSEWLDQNPQLLITYFPLKFFTQDYFTTGRLRPNPDVINDYVLMSAMEMDGYTNLVFNRKRKTGDVKDVEIKV